MSSHLRRSYVSVLVTCAVLAFPCLAQTVTVTPDSSNSPRVSQSAYLDHLGALQRLADACRLHADACDPAKVGDDEKVESADGKSTFDAQYEWLRDTLKQCQKASDADRAALLDKSDTRLAEDAEDAAPASAPAYDLQRAQQQAETILHRPQFGTIEETSFWQRQLAKLAPYLDRGFRRMAGGAATFWPLVEWGFLTLALAGLLLWVWTQTRRQRLTIVASRTSEQAQWQKESDDWAARAHAEAAAQQWRDAVHCLYWAAIVMLEGRKLWRQNRARTPREYLALLEDGSAKRDALSGLTRIFERIWYGLRPAGQDDYEQARLLLDTLRTA